LYSGCSTQLGCYSETGFHIGVDRNFACLMCMAQIKLEKSTEVGSAAYFSGPQYTIQQLCYRSAQCAITQCFQICQYAMRNAAIADTSATHNHSKEKIKIQNKKIIFIKIKIN
jgi:hypothetical protein